MVCPYCVFSKTRFSAEEPLPPEQSPGLPTFWNLEGQGVRTVHTRILIMLDFCLTLSWRPRRGQHFTPLRGSLLPAHTTSSFGLLRKYHHHHCSPPGEAGEAEGVLAAHHSAFWTAG